MIFAGAEHIVSPLGNSAEENFAAIIAGKSGIRKIPCRAGGKEPELFNVAAVRNFGDFPLAQELKKSVTASLEKVDESSLISGKTLFLLSTTKGEITELVKPGVVQAKLDVLRNKVIRDLHWFHSSAVISNACISGLEALIVGHDLIQTGNFDHVVVAGGDMLSEFTLSGFKSFFAISPEPCKPFDKNRAGINLGEGVGTIILSRNEEIFASKPIVFCGGATANDANHISGPSRTGEGLYRAISRALTTCSVRREEIDFFSSHGTGTSYNDEMESIAFARCGMSEIPMNGLKGYFGHTLGAAGIIEAAVCMQSLRNQELIASTGFEEAGTSKPLNVLLSHRKTPFKVLMKTASGFGGSNAAAIFRTE